MQNIATREHEEKLPSGEVVTITQILNQSEGRLVPREIADFMLLRKGVYVVETLSMAMVDTAIRDGSKIVIPGSESYYPGVVYSSLGECLEDMSNG